MGITRAKPYTLYGEPTTAMVEQIDEMLGLLFQDLDLNERFAGEDGQFLRTTDGAPVWAAILESDIADGLLLARVGDDETISGDWTFSGTVAMPFTAGSVVFTGADGVLSEDNDKLFWDAANFRLGIGTATPAVPLHVQAAVNVSARLVNTVASSSLQGAGVMAAHDDGAAMASGDRLGFLLFAGARDAASTLSSAIGISGFAEGNWTGISTPSYLLIETTPSGSTTRAERIRVTASGLVNIVTDAGLGIIDTNASHFLRLDCGSNLTADRVLSFVPGDAARTITINGNPTLNDWFDQSVKAAASPTFVAVTLTNGQVVFPATQVASAGANTLDDYEEGTWTPTITGDSGAAGGYVTQIGRYIKIGRVVALTFRLQLSSLGTLTGQAFLSGFPFATANVANLNTIAPTEFALMTTAMSTLLANVAANDTRAFFQYSAGAVTSMDALQITDMSDDTRVRGTFIYLAEA